MIHGGTLNNIGGGKPLTLLAPTDLGGEILFATPHRIVASNYHREWRGIQYVWDSETIADIATLEHKLAERHVDALLICPPRDPFKASILERLRSGKTKPPEWLTPIPYPLPPDTYDDKPDPEHPKPPRESIKPALFLVKAR